jgi:hypothetical protein
MIADPKGSSFIVRTVEHRRYSDGAFVTHDPSTDMDEAHYRGAWLPRVSALTQEAAGITHDALSRKFPAT